MSTPEFNANHGHNVPDPTVHSAAPLEPGFVADWGKQGSFTSSYRESAPDLPLVNVTTTFDQPNILLRAALPEATPALLGLRKWILNRRLEVKETTIKELAVEHEVMKYAGEAILKGTSYMHPHPDKHPKLITGEDSSRSLAPVTFGERRRAGKLLKVARKIREENAMLAHLEKPYNGIFLKDKVTPNKYQVSALVKSRHSGVAASVDHFWNNRLHKNLKHEIGHGDNKFLDQINMPKVKLNQKRRDYEELLLKRQALEEAIASKKARAAAKKIAKQAAAAKTAPKP